MYRRTDPDEEISFPRVKPHEYLSHFLRVQSTNFWTFPTWSNFTLRRALLAPWSGSFIVVFAEKQSIAHENAMDISFTTIIAARCPNLKKGGEYGKEGPCSIAHAQIGIQYCLGHYK